MIEFEKVSNSIWAHTRGITRGNVAFIKMTNFLIFVDSGMDPITTKDARRTAEELTKRPVKYLILTHHHVDHVLGAQVFEDCEIVSSKRTAELMEKQKESWSGRNLEERIKSSPEFAEKWKNLKLIFPTRTFSDKTTISDDNKEIQIIETGGHTAGSSFIYVPWEKVIIAGDLLFLGTWPYGGDPTADPYLWLRALENMLSFDVKHVVPGHGPVGTKGDIQNYYLFMKSIITKIETSVKEGISKEELLTQTGFPSMAETETERAMRFRKLTIERFYDAIKERLSK